MAERAPSSPAKAPSMAVVYWKYILFWLLLFGVLYVVSLYGIVAEA